MVGRVGEVMQSQGAFIVLESTTKVPDSVASELIGRLQAARYVVLDIIFPRQNSQASYFTRQLASGAYGTPSEIGPYTESLLELLDFFDAAAQIRSHLSKGGVVIARHYTGSAMATHGQRFIHDQERRGFYIWLDNMASSLLKIPRPTQTFVLRSDRDTAHKVGTYMELSQLFPHDFKLIDLIRSGQAISHDAAVDLLWETITPLLPPPDNASQPVEPTNTVARFNGTLTTPSNFTTPPNLPDQIRQQYEDGIGQLLTKHQTLTEAVTKFAVDNLLLADLPQLQNALTLALPVATQTDVQLPQIPAHIQLSGAYGQQEETLRLANVNPRNELNLLQSTLYTQSHLSLNELSEEINTWSYRKKSKAFIQALSSENSRQVILNQIHYQWDVLASFLTLYALQSSGQVSQLAHQPLTPRYGYDVPEVIEKAGAGELYEDCFDLSLQLHSHLVAAGHEHEAQYVTLMGHKVRWSCQQSARQVNNLMQARTAGDLALLHPLIAQIETKLREVHPLLLEYLTEAR